MLQLLWAVVLASLPSLPGPHVSAADNKKEPYIEIDFTPMPGDQVRSTITVTVETTDKDLTFSEKIKVKMKHDALCDLVVNMLTDVKFKAEVIDKSKVRVYGRMFNDKFLPVTKGSVTSPDLKKEQLPTVRYVGRKL